MLSLTPFSGWRPCWRQAAAPYRPLAWPSMAELMCALSHLTYCRRDFCSWMTCCAKKHFLLFSFSLPLSSLSWCSSVHVLEEMVKNLSIVGRTISNYWEGLNIKESLTFCSTKFLITASVLATFPEVWTHLRNVQISRSHWDDFHYRHTSWLFCLQSVLVEFQCAYGLGVCRQQTWLLFDPFPLLHHISCWNALRAKGIWDTAV